MTQDPIQAFDWQRISTELGTEGWSVLPSLATAEECASLAALWEREDGFRSRVVMARHGYGQGEYRYFAYPLPEPIEGLRTAL